jgi:hypothetical protein
VLESSTETEKALGRSGMRHLVDRNGDESLHAKLGKKLHIIKK